jgi:hypothetical protein
MNADSSPPGQTVLGPPDDGGMTVLVMDRDFERGRSLTVGLPEPHRVVLVPPHGLCSVLADKRRHFDIVLLWAEPECLDGLAFIYQRHESFGFPEIVFVVEDQRQPEAQALRSSGLQRVLPRGSAVQWLSTAASPLAALAKANRLQREALKRIPPLPNDCPDGDASNIPSLPHAESRYREAFLRLLLATTGSRRAAAAKAGVPYRSFCHMLRKLGIEPRSIIELDEVTAGQDS